MESGKTNDSSQKLDRKIQYRLLALLLGIGIPYGSYQLFQYDELLHMALRFPNWVIGIFAGPMTGLPLGLVIASFPILLAVLSGAAIFYAWKLWTFGAKAHENLFDRNLSRSERRLQWLLVMAIAVPLYSLVLVYRASGSYFQDGLVPFWIERGFSVQRLKVILPYTLYSLFLLAMLTSWIAFQRFKVKLAEAVATEIPVAEPIVDESRLPPLPPPPVSTRTAPLILFRAVLAVNFFLLVFTFVFIEVYGRRAS